MVTFPYRAPAIKVNQRLGIFYVSVLPAELLLQVAASEHLSATINETGDGYELKGTQRPLQEKRLNEIAQYIERVDAAFPNSIIIAANYDRNTGFDQGEMEDILVEETGEAAIARSKEWTVEEEDAGLYTLNIPTGEKLAAVIDGQHRLFSFAKVSMKVIRSMELLCAVYVDLPKPLQAQIFATINSTQKRVDRSLTYELFGYNVSEESEDYWTPDKLAVFFTRKLSTHHESPLAGRIVVAPKRDRALRELALDAKWQVSTAVVVDGIVRLFSSNPKRDSNQMRKDRARTRESLRKDPKNDRSPLRAVYLEGNDALLYNMVLNYTRACNEVFWEGAKQDSFIVKTIGMQALFDILRKLAGQAYGERDISAGYFVKQIGPAGSIDFSDEQFRNPSGSGRTFIRKTIERAIGLGVR